MILSDTYADNYMNFLLGKVKTLTAPAKIYLGLSSNDPEADGGIFEELSGNNYSRVIVSVHGSDYPDVIGAASDRTIKNTKQIAWPKAGADVRIKGIGLFSSESGDSLFAYGKLDMTEEQEAEGGILIAEGAIALIDAEMLELSASNKSAPK